MDFANKIYDKLADNEGGFDQGGGRLCYCDCDR